ncbi:hypothetical protein HYX17_02795 [Candidatus Woesearchaeota archaeon]|nr:hypothetical protein [Candidatus Woesearchaeota archaeon]
MKLRYIIIFILLLIQLSIAQPDTDKAFEWLLSQQEEGSYNNDIIDTSIAILALKGSGATSQVEKSIDYLLSQKNPSNCWPKLNCNVKDTSFALLALDAAGESTTEIADWLKDAQSSSSTTGKWLLEIANAQDGECTIKYNKQNNEIVKKIKIEDGKIPSCNNNNWIDLNSCLESNLLTRYPSLTFDVDCSSVNSNVIIVLLFNVGNTYTFVDNVESSSATITVDNNCYGTGFKDRCNMDSTLYASYALSKIEEPTSIFYLKSNYDSNNPEHSALMNLITEDSGFLDDLTKKQRTDGSFENSVFKTSLAILTLEDKDNALEWLENKQNSDGSFGSVFDTSFALLALSPELGELASCLDNTKNQGEEGIDCGGPCSKECGVCNLNDVCEEEKGEDSDNCPSDCLESLNLCSNGKQDDNEEGIDCGGPCSKECPSCNNDGKCEFDTFGETSLQCPKDCSCGDDICDSTEKDRLSNTYCAEDCREELTCNDDGICDTGENSNNCPDDCEEQSTLVSEEQEGAGFPFTAIIIIVVIGLIIVFSIYYFTKKKKKPEFNLFGRFAKEPKEKPSSRPEIPKFPGSKPSLKETDLDKELDRSLEEARKLIKRK